MSSWTVWGLVNLGFMAVNLAFYFKGRMVINLVSAIVSAVAALLMLVAA